MRETLLLFIVLTEYCSSSCLFCPVLSSLNIKNHRKIICFTNNAIVFICVAE